MAVSIIEVRDLVRTYGRRRALDGVSLTVQKGSVLGLVGGVVGILFGWGALHLLAALPQTASIVSTTLDPLQIIEALAIAVLSGLIAGAYPAWRGAHLSPVEALRHD